MLTFDCIYTKRIEAVGQFEAERRVEATDLPGLFHVLFPRKAAWFRQQDRRAVTVSFSPDGPFGPDPEVLLDFLFDDLLAAAESVRDRLGLRTVSVHGPPKTRRRPGPGLRFVGDLAGGSGARLTAVEFRRLAEVARKGEDYPGRLVSVFVEPGVVASFCAAKGTLLKDVLQADRRIAEWFSKNPDARPRHPITGRQFDPQTHSVGDETDLLSFREGGYTLRPKIRPMTAFPYFDHHIRMARGRTRPRRVRPCNNCLACRSVCPSELYPSLLYHNLEADNLDEAIARNLAACIRCGRCSFVCPTGLPLHERLAQGLETVAAEEA